MSSWWAIGKHETRNLTNRPACISPVLLALVTAAITSGCATTRLDRPVEDCVAMTDEELQRPIHIERFNFVDHTGLYHRVRVSVEVGLDGQGYVTNPRVSRSNVRDEINAVIVNAVSQWRWCPQFSEALEGSRFEIPFDIPVRNLGGSNI
jgi:hypothetical protein